MGIGTKNINGINFVKYTRTMPMADTGKLKSAAKNIMEM
jgi:hypothetical protein